MLQQEAEHADEQAVGRDEVRAGLQQAELGHQEEQPGQVGCWGVVLAAREVLSAQVLRDSLA